LLPQDEFRSGITTASWFTIHLSPLQSPDFK